MNKIDINNLKSAEPLNIDEVARYLSDNDVASNVKVDDEGNCKVIRDSMQPNRKSHNYTNEELRQLAENSGLVWRDEYADRAIAWWASDERVDRHGDIVLQNWIFDTFKDNPVMLYSHEWDSPPIGSVIKWDVVRRRAEDYQGPSLQLLPIFAMADEYQWADTIFRLAKARIIRTGSVGFFTENVIQVTDAEERKSLGLGPEGMVFDKNVLVEWTVAPVPANTGAVQVISRAAKHEMIQPEQDLKILRDIRRTYDLSTGNEESWQLNDYNLVEMWKSIFPDCETGDHSCISSPIVDFAKAGHKEDEEEEEEMKGGHQPSEDEEEEMKYQHDDDDEKKGGHEEEEEEEMKYQHDDEEDEMKAGHEEEEEEMKAGHEEEEDAEKAGHKDEEEEKGAHEDDEEEEKGAHEDDEEDEKEEDEEEDKPGMGYKMVVPYEATPVSSTPEASWDSSEAELRIRDWALNSDGDIDWAKYMTAFAYVEPGDEDILAGYKLPHHDIENGELVTHRRGVIAAMAALNGARAAMDLTENERSEIYTHLSRHYSQFNMEAPDLIAKSDLLVEELTKEFEKAAHGYAVMGTSASGPTEGTSGYFYPLYETMEEAENADTAMGGDGNAHAHTFEEMPGVTLYMPDGSMNHGTETVPDVYDMYEMPDDEMVEEAITAATKVSPGDYVQWDGRKGMYTGVVSRLQTDGEAGVGVDRQEATEGDPIAHVDILARLGGEEYFITDRSVPVNISRLTVIEMPEIVNMSQQKDASPEVITALENKVEEHNEEYGDDARKKTNLSTLEKVFDRGVGAYRTNPSSVRPTVVSEEQWAYGRVNSFLHALRTLEFRNAPHDTDLLPSQHPLSSKSIVFSEFAETKDGHVDLTVPEYIRENARRGLEYYDDGLGGDGLRDQTVADARDMARGQITEDKVRRMRAWFLRHQTDLEPEQNNNPDHEDFPGPGAVAWYLWGGNATSNQMQAFEWADRKVMEMERDSSYGSASITIETLSTKITEVSESLEARIFGLEGQISDLCKELKNISSNNIKNHADEVESDVINEALLTALQMTEQIRFMKD